MTAAENRATSMNGEMKNNRVIIGLATSIYLIFCGWAYADLTIGWVRIKAWVYAHETLAGGLLALGSALTGAWFLYRQTSQTERHERDRRGRRREAVRTVLPLTLSELVTYAKQSATATKQLLDQCVDTALPDASVIRIPTLPELPKEAVSVLRELVEAVEATEVRTLAILIADLQVQHSRLSSTIAEAGHSERITVQVNLEEYLLDCARIYARVASLFRFARRASDDIPVTIKWSEVQSAVISFGLYEEEYEALYQTIRRRSGDDLSAVVSERWGSLGH